jgi:hypothetical protein
MMGRSQKLVALIFTIATILSTVVIVYSFTNYVGVSLAVRSMSAFVADFHAELIDEGHVTVTTMIVVNNTSQYQFSLLGLEQQVYVNQTYAGSSRETFPQNDPPAVSPRSTTNHTLELHLLLEFLQPDLVEWLLDPGITKTWVTYVDIFCQGPLVGNFQLSTLASKESF